MIETSFGDAPLVEGDAAAIWNLLDGEDSQNVIVVADGSRVRVLQGDSVGT